MTYMKESSSQLEKYNMTLWQPLTFFYSPLAISYGTTFETYIISLPEIQCLCLWLVVSIRKLRINVLQR
jgi:hypothetical protein